MHKIYSRKRTILDKKIISILGILLVAFTVVAIICKAVGPVFDTLCKDEAKSIATLITNKEATSVMKQYSYEDLFTIEKDEQGNISMIKSNVFPINEIISSIPIKIQEEINSKGRDDIKIALGTFTGIKLLAGRGPGVKIRISSIGNVETDLKSEFYSQGINQTLHRVYLQIKCEITILTPFNDMKEQINNQVLIAENVIVGHIPSSYYNLEGMNNSNISDIIE
ncbi:MAG: sporulation protein YunB [Clostridia bacterium]|nr:sporulation protein YunB [Clostridia bacterium]